MNSTDTNADKPLETTGELATGMLIAGLLICVAFLALTYLLAALGAKPEDCKLPWAPSVTWE